MTAEKPRDDRRTSARQTPDQDRQRRLEELGRVLLRYATPARTSSKKQGKK